MFAFKKEYFLIIQSIKDINLNFIKKYNKFNIIYRNLDGKDKFDNTLKFRNKCRLKRINFFIANNTRLAVLIKADGIYFSSYNKNLKSLNFSNSRFKLIGSAHNFKEINQKIKQGCQRVVVSKLFTVNNKPDGIIHGVVKFNTLFSFYRNIIPLGGIKLQNINKLKMIKSNAFTIMSEIKKKPTISSRLF